VIAVLGAGGQLGTAFVALLGDRAVPVTRRELDFEQVESIQPWIAANHPDLVINCAAYTAVDAAEGDEQTTHRVNALAVGELATACATSGAGLVTFSTDYVFDGTKSTGYLESDEPSPLNVYGRTKLEGEQRCLTAHPAALVIRTSWVLSGTHRNFAATMLDLIAKGPVRVVGDQRGRPTLVDDLARGTMEAVEAGATGVLHLANQGETSWFGLAREIAEIAGLDADLVSACTTAEFPRPARRPENSVLDSERLEGLGIEPLPHYRASLTKAVSQLIGRS
jgi:dTDP-4-dehydrorhamnose reductase